jgi:hypothetical protein
MIDSNADQNTQDPQAVPPDQAQVQAADTNQASGIPEPPEDVKRASIVAIQLINKTHEDIVNTMAMAMEKSNDPVSAVAGASIKVMLGLQEGIKGVSPDVVFSLAMLIVPILLALGEKAKLWSGVGLGEVNAVLQKISQLVAEQQGQPVDAAAEPQAVPQTPAAQQPGVPQPGLLSGAM